MAWLYLRRRDDNTTDSSEWYAGRTGQDNFHNRADSGGHGKFAVGMDGKELAVKIEDGDTPTTTAHYQESEAIQFLSAFVGRRNVGNRTQIEYPVTGYEWEE